MGIVSLVDLSIRIDSILNGSESVPVDRFKMLYLYCVLDIGQQRRMNESFLLPILHFSIPFSEKI